MLLHCNVAQMQPEDEKRATSFGGMSPRLWICAATEECTDLKLSYVDGMPT